VKLFHRTEEGQPFKKGMNWLRVPGWARLVFFCGDCKLYLRLRWKGGLRLFCHWDLRKDQEAGREFIWDGVEWVPWSQEAEDAIVAKLEK
jgi:hypothetical protein